MPEKMPRNIHRRRTHQVPFSYPIITASAAGDESAVRNLLEDVNVNPGMLGNTAIVRALRGSHTRVALLLLSDPRVKPGQNNQIVLRTAVDMGDFDAVQLLVSLPGVKVSAYGYNAILKATQHGYKQVVDLLLEHVGLQKSPYLASCLNKGMMNILENVNSNHTFLLASSLSRDGNASISEQAADGISKNTLSHTLGSTYGI
ncbi:MAG: ankyrin repeat domain-containing protein [Francisellaceae bacterium]|jgi:hypothetical protein|nr:ankyrin repeat domain-containing protein [Francisellaceae bacterium]MBT6208369.1 ankyrin repeat domain-containing protein [Francisellaceae bacterium]MBT6537968.1 ankyrin repeat domain-containing protein [Francisellaceae bacterium]